MQNENPDYGRTVFFINPPLSVETFVVENLRLKQYEVYCIKDYRSAKGVLELYPNAICFIFIDDVLPLKGWFNFIKSFEYSAELKTIFLGILSAKIRPVDKENFIVNTKLPGGFVSLDGPITKVYETLNGILEINGAKGRRKCLRLDCSHIRDMKAYLAYEFRLYSFEIKRLSCVGFSCVMPKRKDFQFQKGQVFNNVCLTLNRKTLVCTVRVQDAFISGSNTIAILMFLRSTVTSVMEPIQKYIYQKLDEQFARIVSSSMTDMHDYIKTPQVIETKVPIEEQTENKDSTTPETQDVQIQIDEMASTEADIILDNIGDLEPLDE